jgi:ribosomal protein L11 methylase PrmA
MFYAKFVDNKFAGSTNTLPEEEGYLEIADDSLMGKILVKETNGIIREQTETELQAEFDAYVLANKARHMIDQATAMLKDSEEQIKNDVWEQYTKEQKDLVTAYRANLKAIQAQKDFSKDVAWPEKPVFN